MMHFSLFSSKAGPLGAGASKVLTLSCNRGLKGPGMHWEPRNVNPMLALRTGECNDRMNETRNPSVSPTSQHAPSSRFTRHRGTFNELSRK